MDTKLRSNDSHVGTDKDFIERPTEDISPPKKRPKSGLIKGLVLIGLVMMSVALMLSGLVSAFRAPNYWESLTLKERIRNDHRTSEELLRYARNLNRFFLYYDGIHFDERSTEEGFVTQADIMAKRNELFTQYEREEEEIRQRYSRLIHERGYIDNDVINYIEQVVEIDDGAYYDNRHWILDSSLIQQRNQEITDLMERYSYSEEDIIEMVIQSKHQNYADIKAYLESNTGMDYYIYDSNRNQVYTNIVLPNEMTIDEHRNRNSGMYYEEFDLNDQLFQGVLFNGHDLAQSFGDAGLSGSIFILRNSAMTQHNDFSMRIESMLAQPHYSTYRTGNLILAIVSLIVLIYALFISLRNIESVLEANKFIYKIHSWVPFTLKIIGAFAAAMLLVFETLRVDLVMRTVLYGDPETILFLGLINAAFLIALVITLEYVIITMRDVRKLMNEPEVHLIKWGFKGFEFIFKCKSPLIIVIYVLMIIMTFIGVLISIDNYSVELLLMVMITAIIAHLFIADYARLVFYIREMAAGKFDVISKNTNIFGGSMKALSKVSEGVTASVTAAVDDKIKSERLKTELITNVSHDLKTPLTSIINYVALLKDLPNQNPTAIEYIDVLDRKSERLKLLIDDLFEATKLNSGNVELTLERVDVVNLINQTMGELSEKISESGLIFRFTHEPEHIYMFCDGNKMYRVFENLIVNILKYAQSDSRAYIDIQESSKGIQIIFRNMSAYELNIPAEELFERFKRGDASRTTEGSGLGLTIARNVVELHGGKMIIDIDGDLFKVTIEFNK